MGAEKAGSKDGVAEYTGKYFGTWPGLKKPYGYDPGPFRSEEHTSELQSLMRISYAVFCLKKKNTTQKIHKRIRSTNNNKYARRRRKTLRDKVKGEESKT